MAHVASILEANVVVGPYSRCKLLPSFSLRYIFLHQPSLTCLTGTIPQDPQDPIVFFPIDDHRSKE